MKHIISNELESIFIEDCVFLDNTRMEERISIWREDFIPLSLALLKEAGAEIYTASVHGRIIGIGPERDVEPGDIRIIIRKEGR